jgi:hypothetical protein
MLIQAGADVNLKTLANVDGWTPLHGAAARGSADVITVLLKHGADPAATDGKGMTALRSRNEAGSPMPPRFFARLPACLRRTQVRASAAGGTVFNANAERRCPHREERRHQARNARECPPAATDQGVVATRLSNL